MSALSQRLNNQAHRLQEAYALEKITTYNRVSQELAEAKKSRPLSIAGVVVGTIFGVIGGIIAGVQLHRLKKRIKRLEKEQMVAYGQLSPEQKKQGARTMGHLAQIAQKTLTLQARKK